MSRKTKKEGNPDNKLQIQLELISDRYKQLYAKEVTEGGRTCSHCGKTKALTNYFTTRNPLMHNQRIGICRACVDKTVNFADFGEAQYFLAMLNLPFFEEAWESALKTDTPAGKYVQIMNLGQYSKYQAATITDIQTHGHAYDSDPYKARIDQLTEEDKGYLKAKWGYNYDILDLLRMEDYYDEMMEDYEITTRSHQDYLIKIVQVSLVLDQLIKEGDFDNYKKMSKTYDDLMKSADFVQNKRNQKDAEGHNAFAAVFEMAEKQGFIPEYHNEENPDLVDKTIRNIKSWMANIVRGETDLDVLLENAAKRVIEQERKEQEDTDAYGDVGGLDDDST